MGQPRRMYLYAANMGFSFWNLVESVGAFILALGVLVFLINVGITARKPRNAPLDPWDARTYEWMTTSPPKPHNFDAIPTVHSLDEFFHRKYAGGRGRHAAARCPRPRRSSPTRRRNADAHIHLPSPSYWPLVVAAGCPSSPSG